MVLVACSGGIGGGVHGDITAQMQKAQPALSQCYDDALANNASLEGTVVVTNQTKAAPVDTPVTFKLDRHSELFQPTV